MKSNEFVEYIKDILAPFGQITARAMFGSYGIYKDGVIIGIVARNELYFKIDNNMVVSLKSFISEPFTYNSSNKLITISYWKVLPEILDQEEKLAYLVSMVFDTSINSNKKVSR
ncbi:TfoX/Sxy family protein [Candidatus Tisiphia endosymbiont of Oplodontha viridula]|uniref:TfoX/Sxy family protein n=1 Tax=Candidatus Tisiphia endosymbiont of Oplodontha viridula TaxID=3077925 RepID=UPI0035C92D46